MRPASAICAVLLLAVMSALAIPAFAECGIASVYWEGARTANGERFVPDGISAAHKTLPFGSRVIVRNQRTGRTILVRINDRGPFVRGRVIDLSRGAARHLGVSGLAPVCLDVVSYSTGNPAQPRDFASFASGAYRFFGAGVRTVGATAYRAKTRVHKTMRRTIRRAVRVLTPHRIRHHGRHRRHAF